MTTVAYRNGRIAGDTNVTSDGIFEGTAVKVARNAFGDLAGTAGRMSFAQAFLAWFAGGEKGSMPECPKNSQAFIVRAANQGSIEYIEGGGGVIQAPYYAIGSGGRIAMGAMAFGAEASQAVICAAKHDAYTGEEIISLTHAG